jgi:hypothetical protein
VHVDAEFGGDVRQAVQSAEAGRPAVNVIPDEDEVDVVAPPLRLADRIS